MSKRYALPFKTVPSNEIALTSWHYRIGGGDWLRPEPYVSGWDYLAQLELLRSVTIDGARARTACGLEGPDIIDLVVTLSSQAARFRSVVFRTPIPAEPWTGEVSVAVPSVEVAEDLTLETEVVLRDERSKAPRLTARYAGSRLFTETVSLEIEGKRSRMPLEFVSFESQLSWLDAPRAPWYIDCGAGDLQAPAMRNLRVFLNADQVQFADAAKSGDRCILVLLKAEIVRQLLETALEDESFRLGGADFAEGSLGQAASRALRLCFGDIPPKDVHALARRDASKFHAMINSQYNESD